MPVYVFRREKDEFFELIMSYDERQMFLKNNPDLVPVVTAPRIISGRGDGAKPDAGFNEMMSKIADQNPQSPLAETYGSKDSKSVKTREVVNKAVKKSGGLVG